MAHVLAVLNTKGGSGKTTLAVNIACCLQRAGETVLLVDTDTQATASDWRAGAESDGEAGVTGTPGLVSVTDPDTLAGQIGRIASGYDFAVIDGSAKTQGLTGAAVRAADVVAIPIRPSPADLWAAGDLVEIITARQQVTGGQPAAAFVVSAAPTGANLSAEVTEALGSYRLPVLEARTGQRVAYAEELIGGGSVLDRPSSKAAGEIEAITAELRNLLNSTQK